MKASFRWICCSRKSYVQILPSEESEEEFPISSMVGAQPEELGGRRSTRLLQKRGRVLVHDLPGTNLLPRIQTAVEREGDVIVVSLAGTSAAGPGTAPDPEEEEVVADEVEADAGVEEETEEEEEDEEDNPMAPSTRLKYNRFKGDGSQDVDEWLCEFESIALANQEDPDAKRRIFQGLLKGEALQWYQDVPERTRNDWTSFVTLFRRTFREAGGEARALGKLSRMTMRSSESVRKYSQRVKALIQKLTTAIAPSVQVEWFVAGFPEEMGFQIRQTRPATLQEAVEAAQNYENSAQSLRKSLKHTEKRGKKIRKERERRRRHESSSEDSDSTSKSDSTSSSSDQSEEDSRGASKRRGGSSRDSRPRRNRELIKVKVEDDDSRKVMKEMKEIRESIAELNVHLSENRKPRKMIPTSRANVWCANCGKQGHYPPECTEPRQKRIHYVHPEEEVYFAYPEEEEFQMEEYQPVYQVQTTYGRGKAPIQIARPPAGYRIPQNVPGRPMYQKPTHGYCFNCGSPDHYAPNCPFERQGQGAPRILPCQNCGEYGHTAPQCAKPAQPRPTFKQVEVPPREMTGLNYGHSGGIENPDK